MCKPLYEQARPLTWNELVGQDKAKERFDFIRSKGQLAGKVYYLTGSSGTGKTTIARLIANEVAEDWSIIELDAADLNMETVRDFERISRARAMGEKGSHCFIINESHRLSSTVVSRLLSTFEREECQRNSTWIFTTTSEGDKLFDEAFDSCPFGSRCLQINLSRRDLSQPFAERLKQVAVEKGYARADRPLADFVRLLKDRKNNMRECYSYLETGVFMS